MDDQFSLDMDTHIVLWRYYCDEGVYPEHDISKKGENTVEVGEK